MAKNHRLSSLEGAGDVEDPEQSSETLAFAEFA